MESAASTSGRADEGWRTQPYMLEEGTYEFDVDVVEGRETEGLVMRLRVAEGPLEGRRILLKEAEPVAGLREAIASGTPCRVRGTIKRVQGRGKRFLRVSLV